MSTRSALVALLALGCSDAITSTRGARSMKANMSVSATISSRSATQVLLLALFSSVPLDSAAVEEQSTGAGYLGAPTIVDLTTGSSQAVSMSVDLSQCLAAVKARGTDTCPYVYVEAFLLTGQNKIDPNDPTGFLALTGNNLLDVDIVGPFSVSLNATATTPRAIVLHEVESINVSPTFLTLSIGQSTNLTAAIVDIYNNPVTGRTVTWASANNAVATVTATGQVLGIAPGSTTITASAGGRSTIVPVSVQLPRILVNSAGVTFNAIRSSIPIITPSSATVAITSSGGATSPITLQSPTTTYGTAGLNWLGVSLNTATTPATVTVTPTNIANLLNGTYLATITIRSTNSSISSAAFSVTLNITTPSSGSITVLNSGRP